MVSTISFLYYVSSEIIPRHNYRKNSQAEMCFFCSNSSSVEKWAHYLVLTSLPFYQIVQLIWPEQPSIEWDICLLTFFHHSCFQKYPWHFLYILHINMLCLNSKSFATKYIFLSSWWWEVMRWRQMHCDVREDYFFQ